MVPAPDGRTTIAAGHRRRGARTAIWGRPDILIDGESLPSASTIAIAGLAALAVSAAAIPLVLRLLARLQVLDVANDRSSHRGAVPRGAGIAVMAGIAVGAALGADLLGDLLPPVLLVSLAAAAVGLADDVRSRPAIVRLAAQGVLAIAGVTGVLWALPHPSWWSPLLALPAVLFVIGYLNAFNFMDGVNGISGLTALVVGASLVAVALVDDLPALGVLGAVLAGSAAGFLPSNVPEAKAFLGDVGSYGLGAWIALSALACALTTGSALVAIAPLSIYLADTSWTLLRRARRGARLLKAHREHVYQRLTDLGWSHLAAATFVAGSAAVASAVALVAYATRSTAAQAAAVVGVGAVATAYLATPGLVRRSATTSDAVG